MTPLGHVGLVPGATLNLLGLIRGASNEVSWRQPHSVMEGHGCSGLLQVQGAMEFLGLLWDLCPAPVEPPWTRSHLGNVQDDMPTIVMRVTRERESNRGSPPPN
eukprot:CAMPEP_0179105652 /NCGR_PEP_ID=MMETSP0796-20121207/49078_1 /TAXON_ID=73915 /ORGANISM="Pyrodinium bahamense, Strain pbaha01" /LENGTH=103 /DNA_ID=CAMNT_0020803645 /DNA_START=65 /DNA_END=374 /DNA_ORIENTATION=+